MAEQQSVGIVSVGTYSPQGYMTAAEIAAASGLPEWVIRDKMGITGKHVAGPDDQPNEMAIKAALDCLSRTDIPASEIDVVLCTTEEWREYLLWTTGIHLAHAIGAVNAWAVDLHMRCATTVGALKMAKDMMLADPEIDTVLIAGGHRVSDFIDFRNPRTSFMKNRLNAVSTDNWLRCVDEALRKSGRKPDGSPFTRRNIDYLNMILIRPSGHQEMLERLGLAEEQSVYLGAIGHTGEQDAMFSIREGLASGRLKDGDLMAIVAAGIGYVWAASVVQWGEVNW